MQHRNRDPESSQTETMRDRYALCALTGTAFSIICEFRANFELHGSLCSRLLLLPSFVDIPIVFSLSFSSLPLALQRFAYLSRSVTIDFQHIQRYKSAHDISHIVQLISFVCYHSYRRDCTSCTTATISYTLPMMCTDRRWTKSARSFSLSTS